MGFVYPYFVYIESYIKIIIYLSINYTYSPVYTYKKCLCHDFNG
nr:MAG TPA: hypothetical protein [Caudoviricetes sp.]